MRFRRVAIGCLGLAMIGCGQAENRIPTQDDSEQTALGDVAELYRLYTLDKKKPPASISDFKSLEQMSPMGLKALSTGSVIVRFGATMSDTDEGPAKTSSDDILAYQKDVPQSGGKVLMLDRTIRKMTAEEFKAAKLAGSSSSTIQTPKKS